MSAATLIPPLCLAVFLSLAVLPPSALGLPAGVAPLPATSRVTFAFDVDYFSPEGYLLNINAFSGDAQCRKVAGWSLAWAWTRGEFVWALKDGVGIQDKGDCSKVYPAGGGTPFSCIKAPTVVDQRVDGTNGNLVLMKPLPGCQAQACGSHVESIKMIVGNATNAVVGFVPPLQYKLAGHVCSAPDFLRPDTNPCKFKSKISWQVTCVPATKPLRPAAKAVQPGAKAVRPAATAVKAAAKAVPAAVKPAVQRAKPAALVAP